MTDELRIQLDRKRAAFRSGQKWVVSELRTDGSYDMIDHWTGGPRTLLRWCAANDVHPTREAEARIAELPEEGFKDRG